MEREKRLIDANALKANFVVLGEFANDLWHSGTVRIAIDNAPTVDAVEVVHGRWEAVDHDGSWRVDKCSACHKRMHYVDYDQPYAYCPNCGAKMDGDGNE